MARLSGKLGTENFLHIMLNWFEHNLFYQNLFFSLTNFKQSQTTKEVNIKCGRLSLRSCFYDSISTPTFNYTTSLGYDVKNTYYISDFFLGGGETNNSANSFSYPVSDIVMFQLCIIEYLYSFTYSEFPHHLLRNCIPHLLNISCYPVYSLLIHTKVIKTLSPYYQSFKKINKYKIY